MADGDFALNRGGGGIRRRLVANDSLGRGKRKLKGRKERLQPKRGGKIRKGDGSPGLTRKHPDQGKEGLTRLLK